MLQSTHLLMDGGAMTGDRARSAALGDRAFATDNILVMANGEDMREEGGRTESIETLGEPSPLMPLFIFDARPKLHGLLLLLCSLSLMACLGAGDLSFLVLLCPGLSLTTGLLLLVLRSRGFSSDDSQPDFIFFGAEPVAAAAGVVLFIVAMLSRSFSWWSVADGNMPFVRSGASGCTTIGTLKVMLELPRKGAAARKTALTCDMN